MEYCSVMQVMDRVSQLLFSVTGTSVAVVNERQKVEVKLYKDLEQDELFRIGSGDEILHVYFALYAAEELTAADGKYTIPAAKLTGEALTVTVEKTAKQILTVEVAEYLKLNGRTMWLVTAAGTVSVSAAACSQAGLSSGASGGVMR